MNTPKGKIPAFFTVFITEECSQRMLIPSDFTAYMKRKLPESRAFLRNRCGSVWRVDVIRKGHDLYFGKGWTSFVEANGVEMGDLLFFQFCGDSFYDFKHFDKTSCEKEAIRLFNFTVKQEEPEEGEGNEEEKDANDDDESDDDYGYEEEDDESEDHEKEKDFVVKKIKKLTPKKESEISHAQYQKPGTRSTDRGKGKAVVKQGNRGTDIFESGLIAKPDNAYFVTDLKARKRTYLYIPNKVIVKWNIKLPEKINIVGEDGKKFASKIATYGDGRSNATDGWRAFCRWNFVKAGEMCLCEFLTNQELLVRILHFHAGKWMPRQRN